MAKLSGIKETVARKEKFDRIMCRYIKKMEKKKIKYAKKVVKAGMNQEKRRYKWHVVWPKRAELLTKLLFAGVCFAIFYIETKDKAEGEQNENKKN